MQIFSGIESEITLFLGSVVLGSVMLLFYDFLRVLRRAFHHGILWISIEDFLYWSMLSGWFFLEVCTRNDGIIRFYMLFGMGLGAYLCNHFVGRYYLQYMTILIHKVKKRLKNIKEMATIKLKKRKEARKDHGRNEETTPS